MFTTISRIVAVILTCVLSLAFNPIMAPAHSEETVYTVGDIEYNGYICYLEKSGEDSVDLYLRANEDCALQAFDIYLDTEGHDFEVVSNTGKNIDTFQGRYNLMSIANGLEMPMERNKDYKLATVILKGDNTRYSVKIVRIDLAIALTPMAPEIDTVCYEFMPITIN